MKFSLGIQKSIKSQNVDAIFVFSSFITEDWTILMIFGAIHTCSCFLLSVFLYYHQIIFTIFKHGDYENWEGTLIKLGGHNINLEGTNGQN